ncbi:gp53-like domain-containing protein [Escherichia coli]|uniref:gp53-like domain-containing protein n=1 Tax=Escherichia coli TaxID=562 RepID=UPI0040677BB3
MAKNDFKAFATDRNANVISQEEWEALPALLSGFTAGKASSAQVNKVIRQASFIAAALAQFVSDKTQRDVLDNGDLPGFVELLGSGFAVEYLSRKNPFGDIKSDGTVKTALENLGLGEAATRNVGTDTGQVPDMSSFTTGHSGAADWPNTKSGWSKGPDGVITQWGIFGFPVGQTGTNVVFPLPFPARVESITLTMADIQEYLLSPTTMPAYGVNSTGTSRTGFTARMSGAGGFNLCYIAKGR